MSSSFLKSVRDLLNANAIRRIAGPLRVKHPRLYARLNEVRKRLLVGGRRMEAYQANALSRFREVAPLRGRQILEIGSDPELRALRYLVEGSAAQAIGVNNSRDIWLAHPSGKIEVDGAQLIEADATHLPFPSASFDSIFSVATFEHILDLGQALAEMHRVLVPGGVVYSNFGPLWSSGKGHHLRVAVDGEEARHQIPEQNPLPDFVHLLLSPAQLRKALRGRVSDKLVEPIVDGVYHDPGVNRLFYHQYIQSFHESPFAVGRIATERDPVQPQLRKILEYRYPGEKHFDVTNMEVVLVKPA